MVIISVINVGLVAPVQFVKVVRPWRSKYWICAEEAQIMKYNKTLFLKYRNPG